MMGCRTLEKHVQRCDTHALESTVNAESISGVPAASCGYFVCTSHLHTIQQQQSPNATLLILSFVRRLYRCATVA